MISNQIRDKIVFLREASGMSSREIASQLELSQRSVKTTLQVFAMVQSQNWPAAENMLRNHGSYKQFQWAADRTGVKLPDSLRSAYENSKAARVKTADSLLLPPAENGLRLCDILHLLRNGTGRGDNTGSVWLCPDDFAWAPSRIDLSSGLLSMLGSLTITGIDVAENTLRLWVKTPELNATEVTP